MNSKIIVMVGLPGSGKSTYISQQFNNSDVYYIVDGDTLKTSVNVCKSISANIKTGKTLVVDATNYSLERRADIIRVAQQYNAQVECIYISTPKGECILRAKNRKALGGKDVPPSAIGRLANQIVIPKMEEGFSSITVVKPQ
jgi:predicted kinase